VHRSQPAQSHQLCDATSVLPIGLDTVSVCIVDGTGKIVCEAKVATEPDALVSWFLGLGLVAERIGMEAGPLSQWLHEGMRRRGSQWSSWTPDMYGTPSRLCL
jgi:hypothetical protein